MLHIWLSLVVLNIGLWAVALWVTSTRQEKTAQLPPPPPAPLQLPAPPPPPAPSTGDPVLDHILALWREYPDLWEVHVQYRESLSEINRVIHSAVLGIVVEEGQSSWQSLLLFIRVSSIDKLDLPQKSACILRDAPNAWVWHEAVQQMVTRQKESEQGLWEKQVKAVVTQSLIRPR